MLGQFIVICFQYLPPARPNGIPIHDIPMEVMSSNESDVLSLTYLLTIRPATCQTNVPLISVTLLDAENAPSKPSIIAIATV